MSSCTEAVAGWVRFVLEAWQTYCVKRFSLLRDSNDNSLRTTPFSSSVSDDWSISCVRSLHHVTVGRGLPITSKRN